MVDRITESFCCQNLPLYWFANGMGTSEIDFPVRSRICACNRSVTRFFCNAKKIIIKTMDWIVESWKELLLSQMSANLCRNLFASWSVHVWTCHIGVQVEWEKRNALDSLQFYRKCRVVGAVAAPCGECWLWLCSRLELNENNNNTKKKCLPRGRQYGRWRQ